MTAPQQDQAILFVDISGSTRLYETLGDAAALARVEHCLATLERATRAAGGRVVKSMGDGLMCAFGDADAAIRGAAEMQLAVAAERAADGPALDIHVGCHFGPVIESGNDLYGDAVNTAARVAGLAKSRQIIASDAIVARLTAPLRDRARAIDRVPVKGKQQELAIFEVVWQDAEDLTMLGTRIESRAPRLRLRFGIEESVFEGGAGATFAIGRDSGAACVLASRRASREHAHIERRRDKFVLVDHSSNGTFVAIRGEPEITLRREEMILRGAGRIAFGQSPAAPEAESLEFVVE
ncbi:MAG: adenylate/guanylate cyclase domain-containing protein [Burkholderiales bacterium]|nr:adenylate/guanylate cyclase domain-containing protein [Burkholderiales bacterium]